DDSLVEHRIALANLGTNFDDDLVRIRATNNVAQILVSQGKAKDALPMFRENLALIDARLAMRDELELIADEAFTHTRIGIVLEQNADRAGALAEYVVARQRYELLAKRQPKNPAGMLDVADT